MGFWIEYTGVAAAAAGQTLIADDSTMEISVAGDDGFPSSNVEDTSADGSFGNEGDVPASAGLPDCEGITGDCI